MIRINLLPRKPKPLFALWRDGSILGVTVFILLIFWMVVMVRMNGRIKAKQRELKSIKKKIEESKLDLEKVEKLKQQKAVLENKINIINSLREQQSGPVHVLDDLSSAIPEQVWINNLSNLGTVLHLSGIAPSYNAVSEFMRNLALSPYFKDIELENITQSIEKGKKYQKFRIACQVQFIPPPSEEETGSAEGKT